MSWLDRLPLRLKLAFLILVPAICVFVAGSLGYLVHETAKNREAYSKDLEALAGMLEVSSGPVILYNDKDAAKAILDSLRARPDILGARILTLGGGVLASHGVSFGPGRLQDQGTPDGVRWLPDQLFVRRTVLFSGRPIGHVELQASTMELRRRQWSYAGFNALVVFCMLSAFGVLSTRLQRIVADPLLHLVEVQDRIASTRDYSIRVERRSAGEIGRLIDGFNRMIEEVEERTQDLRRATETAQFEARHDSLTLLANRPLFEECLRQAVAQAEREGRHVGVLLLDLDRFKIVNDTVGHLAGDTLLRQIADSLRSATRLMDTPARLGGDEFAVVLPGIERVADLGEVAERVVRDVRRIFVAGGREFLTTVSVGIAVYPDNGASSEELVRTADLAMYRAKNGGGDRFEFYNAALNVRVVERLDLEAGLRRALANNELVVHYQPRWLARTRGVASIEALVRWHHPVRGLLLPSEFIRLAEETGLVVDIDDWVLATACLQAVAWREAGLPEVGLAVNVSMAKFRHRDVISSVQHALRTSGLPAQALELEITEGTAMEDVDYAIDVFSRLKELGVRIALDDFGVGHSSLTSLKRLPLDTLKMDASFIRDVAVSPEDAAIVAAVLALARALDLNVVAEGVETEAQARFLSRAECDELQGFLFGRPCAAETIRGLVGHQAGVSATWLS